MLGFSSNMVLWTVFTVGVMVMLALDLGVFHRKAHAVSFREAAFWSIVWLILALLFDAAIWHVHGREKALQFLTGYLLEKRLSVDHIFVFVIIFRYFGIPPLYQSRVLHWGIIGALFMRFIFIFAGIGLVNSFHWMIYVFGALLIFTGAKMALSGDEESDPSKNPALKLLKRWMPVTNTLHEENFLVRQNGAWIATPLLAALIVVEASDVIFAIDSIPAILAITTDTFIVFTSNIFAVMGLRALYFLLSGLVGLFRFLKLGISMILVFVGGKMLISSWYHVPIGISLAVIAAVLAFSVLASIYIPVRELDEIVPVPPKDRGPKSPAP